MVYIIFKSNEDHIESIMCITDNLTLAKRVKMTYNHQLELAKIKYIELSNKAKKNSITRNERDWLECNYNVDEEHSAWIVEHELLTCDSVGVITKYFDVEI